MRTHSTVVVRTGAALRCIFCLLSLDVPKFEEYKVKATCSDMTFPEISCVLTF